MTLVSEDIDDHDHHDDHDNRDDHVYLISVTGTTRSGCGGLFCAWLLCPTAWEDGWEVILVDDNNDDFDNFDNDDNFSMVIGYCVQLL